MPIDIATSWNKYKEQIELLSNCTFPRQIIGNSAVKIQLHSFCDASEDAYGALIYLRSTTITGVHTISLVCSKTRVTPLKKFSLPRLEICAAILLKRLYKTIRKFLRINLDKAIFWSDSTIVLYWIQTSPHKLKTFVANRVSQIQKDIEHGNWRHVPSQDNPADALSKGQFLYEFINNSI